ncbi:hypothetical protein LSH36_155g04017 [Paralvinella palmiformis]|uniref:Uncharacterized protein n=1 Tax=Paralvinella palmiformis TaxID=53620 RepID=A0AAD9JUA8_9ANNE|nr:hypothetical protein LSH36_155g04017 [Paralvinella palmiformis]
MPKAFDKSPKITYPPGCKELNEELSKDELVRRLKLLARAFQEMGQDENNEYKQLALYLATEFFLDHCNKDVRLLVACCIADIFRIFAPEAPYTEPELLKEIFMFLTQQLRGLADPEAPSFKRYFYLLENLAWVKSFNICIELEDNQEVFCSLYKLMFSIVNDKHSSKVTNFMLDMMCPLIAEADSVSQELLDIIMANIIEPYKSQNKYAYNLAKDLLRRTSNAIEPYIQTFFNNALMLGKSSESEVSGRLYELIYELNTIAPNVLLAVLPQLEFKLKSSDATERKTVTRMLSRMFSEPGSDLAMQNKPLWLCFVGRFNDIDVDVRRICVQACQEFIVNHPELLRDIAEPLKQRQHDPDESVRMDVVQAVIAAAKREFNNITPELFDCVKERILDKKYKIRKEALMGLGLIYKRLMMKEEPGESEKDIISWIRNKILHAYYRTSLEDRILVERLLNTSLVPYCLEAEDRMKRLYILYGSVDDHAVKALHELLRTQCSLRSVLKNLLELHQKEPTDETRQLELNRAIQLARQLPESQKAQEYMKKFNRILSDDTRVRSILIRLVSPDCSCKKAEDYVKEVLKKMGNPIPQNHLYTHVKMLLERVAPVMIDNQAVVSLMKIIDDSICGLNEIGDDVMNASEKGLKLLLLLARMYPGSCQSEEVYAQLMAFVKHDDDTVSDLTLQVFVPIGTHLEMQFPNIYSSLLPVLQKFVKIGTPKQAKHAIRCIDKMCRNKQAIFSQIFEHLQKNMDLDSPNFLTSLVGIGHMAQLCPGEFATPVKGIVSRFIVKDLLMQDRSEFQPTTESWCDDHLVSEETQAKIQALKMVIRWLLGVKSNLNNSASSTLRLLYTLLLHDGDLMERGKINKAEMSRLRLQAGCCMLKLAQEPVYSELVSLEQFQTLALLLNDSSYQVRVRFARKLNAGLMTLKLPLQYLSIFSLAANDPVKERRLQCKVMLTNNITKRRDFLKQHSAAMTKLVAVLPEYVMPFTVHLLAHDPDLVSYTDVETLKNIRECLWFMMEPLIKSENYSFTFYKKMLETIKQTKDAQQPDSDEANYKLYAVCDLALNLVLTKTGNLVLKDFPAEPVLPNKLFTTADPNFPNQKIYLPPELMISSQKGKKVLMVPPMNKIVVTEKINGSNTVSEKGSSEPYTVSSNSSLASSPKEPSPAGQCQ